MTDEASKHEEEIRALLAAWDSIVRRNIPAGERLVPAAAKAKSVLRDGASERDLSDAESRLGIELPPSYRLFLSLSDGAFARPEGAVTRASAKALRHTSIPGLGFLAAADLQLVTDAEPEIVRAKLADVDGPTRPVGQDGELVSDLRPLRGGEAVLITSVEGSQFSALVNVHARAEWQLWVFTRDDVTGYRSFESWLRSAAYEPGVEHVMQLITWERAGDVRGRALDKVSDPAALPYLVAALAEFPDSDRVVLAITHALGRIRTDAAVRLLGQILERHAPIEHHVKRMLATIASPAARDLLARAGAWQELCALDDPRWADLALVALEQGKLYAAHELGMKPDPRFIPGLRRAWTKGPYALAELEIASALRACGAEEGTGYLQAIANDPAHDYRSSAIRLLADEPAPIRSD